MGDRTAETETSGDSQGTADIQIGPGGVWPVFADPRFISLLRHWAAGRQGLMMPRATLDPVAIRTCLPHVWLYRYLPDEQDFHCTLSGEKVNEAWGVSLMGKKVSTLMPPEMAAQVLPLYRRMLDMPAIQVSRRRIVPLDAVEQSSERLIVPLSQADGSPYGILGLTIYHLGLQPKITDPTRMRGISTFYACADLPEYLP